MTRTWEKLATLKGLITADVGQVLYRYAFASPDHQAIVELGSYHGKSTAYLAAGVRDGGGHKPFFAVDAWNPRVRAWSRHHNAPKLNEFRKAIGSVGLTKYVTPIRGLTTKVAERYQNIPIGLLYIDANHAKKAVLADFRAWEKHLACDAVIIFDDYGTTHNPEVLQAVTELHQNVELIFEKVELERLAICRSI